MPAPVVLSGAAATVVAASVGGVVAAEVVGAAVEGGVVAAMVVGGARLVASEMLDTGTPLLHDVSPNKAAPTTNDALNDHCLALPIRRP